MALKPFSELSPLCLIVCMIYQSHGFSGKQLAVGITLGVAITYDKWNLLQVTQKKRKSVVHGRKATLFPKWVLDALQSELQLLCGGETTEDFKGPVVS